MSRAELRRSLAAIACLLSATALAQGLPPSLRGSIDALPPAQRVQVLARQAQLDALPALERARLQQRLADWEARPLQERRARREAWAAWQALPPTERARLRLAATAFAALPADEQQALRARYQALDESERRGWRLGPALGADYAALHALFAQVPEAQREPLLAVLRTLTPGERADLAVLAQRTPPQARDALRRELLSTAAEQRVHWLRRRVDP